MDGKTLIKQLHDTLNEDIDTSGFVDNRTAYEYLNAAAVEFANRTRCLVYEEDLTTVADQTTYNLKPEYVELITQNSRGEYIAQYSDGSTTSWLTYLDRELIHFAQNTTSVERPSNFAVEDYELSTTVVTGTETTGASASAGKATLTDSTATFTTDGVQPGDVIHNTTDASTGYVISVTSETVLTCGLFDGTDNSFGSADDAYSITLQPRYRMVVDPPPSEGDDTITIRGIRKPRPVYSDYDTFGLPAQYTTALVKYAAWLFKYQDDEPAFGDKWYLYFDDQVRKFGKKIRGARNRRGIRVSFSGN